MNTRSCGIVAVIAASLGLSACGGGARQDASEPNGNFPVQVTTATFPSSQTLSEHTKLVISVRNAGSKTIPDIAVTITDPHYGTSLAAFSQYLDQSGLASHSRPVWIVDQPPEPAPSQATDNSSCGYSCQSGGPGGAVTAYSNTWALGALAPGATVTFQWGLTAVAPGRHVIQYRIAAGLNGKAKAFTQSGGIPEGTFDVNISGKPLQAYVNNSGKVVTSK